MGRFNSSATRVVPVFDHLYERDPTGRDWLSYLLSVGSRAKHVDVPTDPGLLLAEHRRTWGHAEKRLAPPRALLEYLIRNVTSDSVERSGDKGLLLSRRRALAARDPDMTAAALKGLDGRTWNRRWYALEGESCPDAFFETKNVILVVEGKRTESSCTTKTKWMPQRSQLLRHMDAATEIAAGRQVYGLLMVEGREPDPRQVPQFWLDEVDAQVADDLLDSSLPHRTAEEKNTIAAGVLGAITWQRVCADFSIPWPPDQQP